MQYGEIIKACLGFVHDEEDADDQFVATPVYISANELKHIITTPMEKGNQYRMNRYGR